MIISDKVKSVNVSGLSVINIGDSVRLMILPTGTALSTIRPVTDRPMTVIPLEDAITYFEKIISQLRDVAAGIIADEYAQEEP